MVRENLARVVAIFKWPSPITRDELADHLVCGAEQLQQVDEAEAVRSSHGRSSMRRRMPLNAFHLVFETSTPRLSTR